MVFVAGRFGQHLQADGFAAQIADLQCRDFYAAALAWQQGDDPAGASSLIVKAVEAVDLTGAPHLEMGLQRAQVGLAELGHVLGLQGQLQGFASVQAGAVDRGKQRRGLGLNAEKEAEHKDADATHRWGS
ncbi:hypothetical protein D3C77_651750 [compost metagenome]